VSASPTQTQLGYIYMYTAMLRGYLSRPWRDCIIFVNLKTNVGF